MTAINRNAALSLYRSILRTHRKSLPETMRQLGDTYVKAEFRLHKDITKDSQIEAFMSEWKSYLQQIQETTRALESRTAGLSPSSSPTNSSDIEVSKYEADPPLYKFGKDLDHDVELSEEQLLQMQKLRDEANKSRKK